MKSVYSSLVALVVFVVLAPLAIADPGTTWENQINGPDRFQVLSDFGGAAVLDKETGRVWEQSPAFDPAAEQPLGRRPLSLLQSNGWWS